MIVARFTPSILALMLAWPLSDIRPAAGASGAGIEASPVIAAVNAVRGEVGRLPLTPSLRLHCAALRHARDIARRATLDHVGADGARPGARLNRVGYRYALAAENLAQASGDARTVVRLWRDSPGHRRNMLDGRLTEAGVGIAEAGGRTYWVMILARPDITSGPQIKRRPKNPGISDNCTAIADDTPVMAR